jgi:hypothetical protein
MPTKEYKICHHPTYSKSKAVSCWLPTMAAWVRSQGKSCSICGGQSSAGTGSLRVLQFPLPILIALTASHSSSISQGWCNRLISGQHTK